MKYKIQGVFTFIQPAHITSGDNLIGLTFNENTGRIQFGGSGLPATGTYRQQLAAKADDDETKWVPRPPVIPPNTIRGAFRRIATNDIVLDPLIIGRGENPVDFVTYRAMNTGSATAAPEASNKIDETIACLKNMFLGLLGGSHRMVESAYSVNLLFPITKETVSRGLIPADYHHLAVKDETTTSLNAFSRKSDPLDHKKAPQFITNFETAVLEYQGVVGENKAQREIERQAAKKKKDEDPKAKTSTDDATKRVDPKHYGFIEVINPGVSFYFEFIVDTTFIGESGLGLFLKTLQAFMRRGQIGGKKNWGFGKFTADAKITVPRDGSVATVNLFTDSNYDLDVIHPEIKAVLSKFDSAMASLTTSDLQKVFALPTKTAPKGKKAATAEVAE